MSKRISQELLNWACSRTEGNLNEHPPIGSWAKTEWDRFNQLQALRDAEPKRCVWKYDGEMWLASCSDAFYYSDDPRVCESIKFCCNCGNEIEFESEGE